MKIKKILMILIATLGCAIISLAVTDENLLDRNVALTNGQVVYTSQTVEERESTERLKVTVGIQTNEISTSATEVCAGETVEMSVSGNSIENNYSLDFPNTAQYSGNAKAVCSSNLADLNITGDFTIEFYIKAEGSYYWHLMGKNTFGNNSQGWLIKKPSTSLSFAWTYNPNEFNFYQPNFGQWEHIAISFDDVSNTFRVFQDGVMVTSEVRDININSSNYDFVIGHELGTGNWFDGKLDNLRISNVSRYTSNFNPSQTFMADASTIAMFDFNEGSGSQAQDISGNGRNLTLYNTNYDTDVPSGSQASYTWSTGETTATISVTPTETTDYWVDVTSNGVTNRETITITVNTTAVPAGDATQSFDIAATVADLSASGENLQWYDAATDGNLLDSTTALTNGQVVYASQTLDGCESTERLKVTVGIQTIQITASATEVCAGETVSLNATIGSANRECNPTGFFPNPNTDIYVSPTGDDNLGNGSFKNPYLTIENAIQNASNNNVITLKDGVYKGTGNVGLSLLGKTITIQGENGANCSIIDCENLERAFKVDQGESAQSIIQGISIINGRALSPPLNSFSGGPHGSAIFVDDNSSLTVRHCVFSKNSFNSSNGEPVLSFGDNEVPGNESFVNHCIFYQNYGMAIYSQKKTTTVEFSVFTQNQAPGSPLIANAHSSSPASGYSNCIFNENKAREIVRVGHGKKIDNCLFYDNTTERSVIHSGTTWSARNLIDHCTFYNNSTNYYNALWSDHRGDIKNSIFYSPNTDTRDHISGTQTDIIYYNSNGSGLIGNNNIDDDPLFVNPTALDFNLQTNSPSIGSAENGADMGVDLSKFKDWMFNYNGSEQTSSEILWSTGETTATISVTPTETTDYWVDVTSNGVTNRETITITVNTTAVPAGDATQSFDIAATVADLSASGENLQWYDAATDGNLLDSTTALTNGQVVYASQTLDGCESTERLTVKISLQSSNLEYPIWELLNPLSELPKANFNFLPYSFDKENRLIYLLNVKENWIYSYQIDTNIFTPIQANNYPSFDNSGSFVFNPSRQTLQFWRSGTDNVYEISTNGGNIIQIGNGSFNAQLYGSDAIYNGVTTNPALMNGYGYFTQKNAAYELLKGIWEEKRGNSGNQPFKRGTIIYPNEDFTKAYIIDGIGNASGNQTESSCSTEGALPWATDVGKYCWLRDLWEIDLSDWSVRSILPLNSNFTTTGSFGYDYENNKFYSFGGFTPPTYYGQELEWNNTLRIFNPNSQSGWIDIEQYGDIPPIGKSYVSYYDLQLNRFIVCSSQGIWALNLSENSGSLSNKEFELQDKIRVYPNPTKNKLFIQGLPNPSKISIYNVLGESVVSETNSKEIDVKKLPLGIYILKIIYNEKETVHKFIKN